MQTRKITLVLIILLLIIFVPLAVYGTFLHFTTQPQTLENTNHEFFYDGKLHFYSQGQLLGTYTCQNTDYCDYAIPRFTNSYEIKEHQEEARTKLPIIQNRYVFLMDTTTASLNTADIILYDLEINKELGRYEELKNYGIGISHDNYIVKNQNGLWGVIQFYDGVNLKIPFYYDYIALLDKMDTSTNLISSDSFAVLKDGSWYLVDINNKKLTESFTEAIVTYNNEYVITSNGSTMHLFTYNGRNRLFGDYNYLDFCGKYIAIVDRSNVFYLFDLVNNQEIGSRHNVANPTNLSFDVSSDRIVVYNDGVELENIAIE